MRLAILFLFLIASCGGGSDGPELGAFLIAPQQLCYSDVSVSDPLLPITIASFPRVYICGNRGETFQTPAMFPPGEYLVIVWGGGVVQDYSEFVTVNGPLTVVTPP